MKEELEVEHVKDTYEIYYNSHSFGMNPDAIVNFSNIHLVTSGMMDTPVMHNEKVI